MVASVLALGVYIVSAAAAQAAGSPLKNSWWGRTAGLCQGNGSLCSDPYNDPEGYYVGHDEPSVEFKSDLPGSGYDMTYTITLPKDPKAYPTASGASGTTWNFELRPTFWFGLALCDNQSAPDYTDKCTPDSDRNNLVGSNPNAPNYIGKHPGTAYMELQFYGPGWVPQFAGFGCTGTQYCAAMTIDSFVENQNTGAGNTTACDNYVLGGAEPINWAYITTSGQSQAPANPLYTGTVTDPNYTAVNPDPSKDLMMNPGDHIRIHIYDTPAGLRTELYDLTTGQAGSMTASVANGFGHILFTPNSSTCQEAPYAFHPQYSTADPRGATWTAHTYNVAMSDEIGHFENCLAVNADGNCTEPGSQDAGGLDEDDLENSCLPASLSALVPIAGCVAADEDFDGQSYRLDWPGTLRNPAEDRQLHPTPLMFTSPVTVHGRNYSTVAFETDLPRIEASDSQFNPPFCNRSTGANCVNPPHGAQFYPFYTTTRTRWGCSWQEGGNYIPGTVDHFGGSSTTEFGPLLKSLYPDPGYTTNTEYDVFNSGDIRNPCPVGNGYRHDR